MTVSAVTVKIECEEELCTECGGSGEVVSNSIDCDVQTCKKCKGEVFSVAYTFKSEDGFDHCWQQIERYIKGRFDGKPTKTHILHTSSFNV